MDMVSQGGYRFNNSSHGDFTCKCNVGWWHDVLGSAVEDNVSINSTIVPMETEAIIIDTQQDDPISHMDVDAAIHPPSSSQVYNFLNFD